MTIKVMFVRIEYSDERVSNESIKDNIEDLFSNWDGDFKIKHYNTLHYDKSMADYIDYAIDDNPVG